MTQQNDAHLKGSEEIDNQQNKDKENDTEKWCSVDADLPSVILPDVT